MMHGIVIGVDPGAFDSTVISLLNEHGVQVLIHESQTSPAKAIARGLLAVQAKQIGKGFGKEARAPWFRQFEKRGRYGR